MTVPKITLVYIYPLDGAHGYCSAAANFVATYQQNPPYMDHSTVIVCNGANASPPSRALFDPLPDKHFITHDNSGWDLGGFYTAARQNPAAAEMMVFCGATAYFRKPGWMLAMAAMFLELGDTLYGATGNQGDLRVKVAPHVRTTGFWCSPSLLLAYPWKPNKNDSGHGSGRYQFEHGQNCLTSWVTWQNKTPWIVGFDCSAYHVRECDSMPNGFHRGDQSNILVGDRLTAPPYYPHP